MERKGQLPTAGVASDLAALLADPTWVGTLDFAAVQRLLDEADTEHDRLETARRALYRRFLRLTTAPLPRHGPRAPRGAPSAEWLTVEDVGARLKKSPTTVRRLLRQGRLPGSRKMGGEWRIQTAAVVAYEGSCPEPIP